MNNKEGTQMNSMEKIIEFSKTLKVLYVEDNKTTRDVALLLFGKFFDNICVAVDGKDGLEKFLESQKLEASEHFNIIISDINMPKMTGLEMIQEIKKIDSYVDVILVSAYDEKNFLGESSHLNIMGYIYKPLEMSKVNEILMQAIKSIYLLSPSEPEK